MSVLLLLAVPMGCGGGGGSPADAGRDASVDAARDAYLPPVDAGPPPPEWEVFLDDYQSALCERGRRCARSSGLWASTAEQPCHPVLEPRWFGGARRRLESGELVLDGAAADACLAWLAGPCETDLYADEVIVSKCGEVFLWAGGAGAACTPAIPASCGTGFYCDDDAEPGEERCREKAREGEPCTSAGDCEGGIGESRCRDGVCDGQAAVGDACTMHGDCAPYLLCADGACAEPVEGMSCDYLCNWTLRCIDGICTTGLSEGDSCSGPESFECSGRLACRGDPDPVCVSTDGRDIGDVCYLFRDALADTCLGELVCREDFVVSYAAEGRCVVGRLPGEECSDAEPCLEGNRCLEGVCTPVVGSGDACVLESACPFGHACVDGACEPLPTPGERCDPEPGCLQGLCADNVCCLVPAWASCAGEQAPWGVCEEWCRSGDICGVAPACDPACDGHACWWFDDRCAPRCEL